MEQQPEAVVVGAGLAGLVATDELVKAGRRVLVLEAAAKAGSSVLICSAFCTTCARIAGGLAGDSRAFGHRCPNDLAALAAREVTRVLGMDVGAGGGHARSRRAELVEIDVAVGREE